MSNSMKVVVTRSAGSDGAVLVLIDTEFEPDGSDGGPALRVLVNDDPVYSGKLYQRAEDEPGRFAGEREMFVDIDDIAYRDTPIR